jgi:hypothetical protein
VPDGFPQHGREHVVEELDVEDAAQRARGRVVHHQRRRDGLDAVHGPEVVEPGDAGRAGAPAIPGALPRVEGRQAEGPRRARAVAQHQPFVPDASGRRVADHQQDPIVVIPTGGDQRARGGIGVLEPPERALVAQAVGQERAEGVEVVEGQAAVLRTSLEIGQRAGARLEVGLHAGLDGAGGGAQKVLLQYVRRPARAEIVHDANC